MVFGVFRNFFKILLFMASIFSVSSLVRIQPSDLYSKVGTVHASCSCIIVIMSFSLRCLCLAMLSMVWVVASTTMEVNNFFSLDDIDR